jgi:hypothetical protein
MSVFSNSLSTAICAFAGGSIAIIATWIFYCLQKRWHRQIEARNRKSLMQAMHDEIEVLWDLYTVYERRGCVRWKHEAES